MRVQPMTEQEAKVASTPPVLPDGDYDCEVFTAVEKTSQSSGMAMFEIDLKVFTPEGKTRTVRDYVMTEGQTAWRLRQCCEAFGALRAYDTGEISSPDLEGRAGRVTLRTEPAQGNYGPKNRVKAYLAPTGQARAAAPARQRQSVSAEDIDDDIPF